MFIDERSLIVQSGNGGDGIVSWRRERRVAFGGPAGGDGGDGGHVLLVASTQLTTFGDMEDVTHARAEHGHQGGRNKRAGRRGEDRILQVPRGTSVYDAETGRLLADLSEDGQEWVAARGGKGGRGNARFASATDQAPRHAEPGTKGRTRRLRMELRLLADVGLVGLPNAGKSTLLSRLSAARPRVADYPFTTLDPHLGVVELPDGHRLVMADLPGLIEGASEGHGLGDRFLRHVERTRILVHVVDPHGLDGTDPVEAWQTIRGELEAYGRDLPARPEILVASKADLTTDEEATREALSRLAGVADRAVYPVSAVTGQGLKALLRALARALASAPPAPTVPEHLEGSGGSTPKDDPPCSTRSSSTSD